MRTPERILKFYKSKMWIRARDLKRRLAKGICEECGCTGQEVHHIIPLTLENIDNPLISIDQSNLQLLCKSCHDAKRSSAEKEVRSDISFDAEGNVIHTPGQKVKNRIVSSAALEF